MVWSEVIIVLQPGAPQQFLGTPIHDREMGLSMNTSTSFWMITYFWYSWMLQLHLWTPLEQLTPSWCFLNTRDWSLKMAFSPQSSARQTLQASRATVSHSPCSIPNQWWNACQSPSSWNLAATAVTTPDRPREASLQVWLLNTHAFWMIRVNLRIFRIFFGYRFCCVQTGYGVAHEVAAW